MPCPRRIKQGTTQSLQDCKGCSVLGVGVGEHQCKRQTSSFVLLSSKCDEYQIFQPLLPPCEPILSKCLLNHSSMYFLTLRKNLWRISVTLAKQPNAVESCLQGSCYLRFSTFSCSLCTSKARAKSLKLAHQHMVTRSCKHSTWYGLTPHSTSSTRLWGGLVFKVAILRGRRGNGRPNLGGD